MTVPVAGGTANANDVTRLIAKSGGTLTISSGVITITPNSGNSLFVVAAESGTADDLDTISGGAAGEIALLIADTGDTITLKHGTGNIELISDTDFDVEDDTITILRFDGSNWLLVGDGGGAAHAAADSAVHGLPSGAYVLGNKNATGEFIQHATMTATTSAGFTQWYANNNSITFAVAFSAAPGVLHGTKQTASTPRGVVTSYSVTTTGFSGRYFTVNATGSLVGYYMAIGT